MFVLNYIYFLLLTFCLCHFLWTRLKVAWHPLDKRQRLLFNGAELFWCLLFATGLLAFSAPAGLDLMAVRLFSLELLCLVCLGMVRTRPAFPLPMALYAVFLAWLVIGLFYTPSVVYGVRVILKYLYPFLVALTASAVVRDGEVFLKASLAARRVALLCIIVSFVPYMELAFPGVFWYGTARAINFISMFLFSLALYFYAGKKGKDLWLAAVFALPCLLWVFRTSIMGTLVGAMAFAMFRYKIRSLPVIAAILGLGVCAVFFVPAVKEKMFKSEDVTVADFLDGKVNMDDVESNARFAMWEYFEKRYYLGHELEGSGTGASQSHFYSNFLFGGLKVMHSDIVQMKCDNGWIALVLYYGAILMMIFHAFRICGGRRPLFTRVCAITAGSSLAGVAVTMYSDNVVNYSMCTLAYPFGFYGMMLGLLKKERRTPNI